MFPAKTLLVVSATLAFVLYGPAQVTAHGSILIPKVTFLDPSNRNAPSVLIPGAAGPYTGGAVLKELADSKGSTCGKTDANGPVEPIPSDGVVQLAISAAHIGPCELWLNEEKVASAKECVKEFPDYKIKVDFAKCKSAKCQLRWIWMATHNSPWEMFDNCVNVGGSGGGGGGDGGKDDNGPATTPAMTPSSPPPTTPKGTTPPATTEPTPKKKATTTQPAPGTVKPSSVDGAATFRGIDSSDALNSWCTANCNMGFCPEEKCVTA